MAAAVSLTAASLADAMATGVNVMYADARDANATGIELMAASLTDAVATDANLTGVNVTDVALIFEGGGTRAAHTAGVVNTLLEAGIYFKDVFGISAGSSHCINYLSRDRHRVRASFVEYMGKPGVAGIGQFLLGRGYFNAHYIYQKSGLEDGILPFDYPAFCASPSEMHIDGYEVDTNSTAHWTKADVHCLRDLMNRVQASSSMPFFMPLVRFDGHQYYDGGLGDSWGIPLERARSMGYQRFFVVCTQERGYRKKPPSHPWVSRLLTPRYPQVAQRVNERWQHYNVLYDELDQLAATGEAVVYHPAQMNIKNTCCNVPMLAAHYEEGYAQAQALLPRWREFLGV